LAFLCDTVAQVENLHQIYKDRPVVNIPESEKPWYDRELLLGNETWRILALFIVIFCSTPRRPDRPHRSCDVWAVTGWNGAERS
jgi:hypothetical protein